jgi:flagellar basal body P-ring protein FlgI
MGTIDLNLPADLKNFEVFDEIGHLEFQPDQKARIVIDDQNGVIAMGRYTRISPVALTHGSITIKVVETPKVYMPDLPNGGIGFLGNSVVGVNTVQLADFAQQSVSLKNLQAEQLKILTDQHARQLADFNTANSTSSSEPQVVNQRNQLLSMHQDQIAQLQENFKSQIRNLQQQQDLSNVVSNQGGIQKLKSDSIINENKENGAVVVPDTKINVKQEKGKFSLLSSGASLDKFVNALNQLGVSVKDMGAILMAIKNAGALHAEIVMS